MTLDTDELCTQCFAEAIESEEVFSTTHERRMLMIVEITETSTDGGKFKKECLRRLVYRIRDRSKDLFSGFLTAGYSRDDDGIGVMSQPYFYVAWVGWRSWMGILPYPSTRLIFAIREWFPEGGEVQCVVYDRRLAEIAKDEVGKFAEDFQLAGVNLVKKF